MSYYTAALEKDTALANACLIAAAPDLLKALKVLATQDTREGGLCFCMEPPINNETHMPYCLQARAAIAKAEGGAQ